MRRAARSRGSLPRLPPDAGKAATQEWAKGAGKGLRAPGRHLRGPKERGAGRGGSFQRLNSIRLQCTGCTFQRLLPRLPPDAGKAAMQEWAKGAGKGLRAPGRHLRGPKEKRCRPRWQLPEAQCTGCALQRLPP